MPLFHCHDPAQFYREVPKPRDFNLSLPGIKHSACGGGEDCNDLKLAAFLCKQQKAHFDTQATQGFTAVELQMAAVQPGNITRQCQPDPGTGSVPDVVQAVERSIAW